MVVSVGDTLTLNKQGLLLVSSGGYCYLEDGLGCVSPLRETHRYPRETTAYVEVTNKSQSNTKHLYIYIFHSLINYLISNC